nr:hypothetical protein [Tanacetum cinerariifolium]
MFGKGYTVSTHARMISPCVKRYSLYIILKRQLYVRLSLGNDVYVENVPLEVVLYALYLRCAITSRLLTRIPFRPRLGVWQIGIKSQGYKEPGSLTRALTARKSVRPLPSHRLALRYTSHHLDHFTSGSSSSHSYSDHSLSGHSSSSHSLSGHTPPDTIVADSFTPSRFVHPPLSRTPQYSEAYLRWRCAPLSTMYPPMTSESSARDSSSELSAGPSRKRCRSFVATVISSIHATRDLVPSRADLLPSRKRFRDSISPEYSVEEDIDTDALEDIEADTTAVEVALDRDVEAGIDIGIGMEVDVGIDIHDGMLMPDAVEHLKHVEEGLGETRDFEAPRLALRYTSHHLDHFTSGSSSSHSSSDHSLSGHSSSSHSLSGHTPPDTIVADSFTPSRFVHPPLSRTPQYSEAYLRWRCAPLSTMYPPMTSESSARDSSSELSAGPSRKRCRSFVATVISSIHATRDLVPSRADLLPSRKRFRDSISPEYSVEEDIDTDALEDI